MTTTKRGHAINGDLFSLRHPSLELGEPFTTFADVVFRGVTHQVFAAADRKAFSFANTTGEFTVGEFSGHLLEQLDTVETQVSHRYQAIVTTPTGVLSVHSYDSVDHVLSLVGALNVSSTRLGAVLEPDPDIEFTTAPRVAISTDLGILDVTPLTAEVIDLLPTWQGTPVTGGQLYGGRFNDDAAYLTLVTDSCRVIAMPAAGADEDRVARDVALLGAEWTS